MRKSREWSKGEIKYLLENINKFTIFELCSLLDRDHQTLCLQIGKLDSKFGPFIEYDEEEMELTREILHRFNITRGNLKQQPIQDYELDLICRAFPELSYERICEIMDNILKSTCKFSVGARKKIYKGYIDVGHSENYYQSIPNRVYI